MIWDFQDGVEYESAYGVGEYDYDSVGKIVSVIEAEFRGITTIPRDPVADYERMHRKAAASLKGTDRARSAFLKSSLERVERMGSGVLLEIQRNGNRFRIVITECSLSILRVKGNENPELEEALADRIAETVGGVARRLIY